MFKSNTGVPLLEFRNLSVARGEEDKLILRGIGIKMEQGEHIALLGPNGCGKSSFINLVTREYYPLSGVQGYSFKVLGREDWNVFDLRYLFGIVSDRLQSVCSRDVTGMETVLSGFFGSVGLYRARVTARMLARALVHDPRGLILDEPCNGLDLHATRRFRDTLRKIAGTGISVILATHNLHDIIPEIKRVVLMKEGGFIADGPKDKLLRSRPISRLFGLRLTIKKTGPYYYVLS